VLWYFYTYNIGDLLPTEQLTKPPIIPTLKQAQEDLGSTTGRLLAAFAAAVSETAEYVALKGERDRSFFSHQVRYLAKAELRNDGVQAEDSELEDTANSGICLSLPDYRIRVLKASADGEAPEPGDSERRKRFLQQLPEQQMQFSFAKAEEPTDLSQEGSEPVHIMYLWEVDSRDHFTGFWFTCPSGTGKYHFKEWIPFGGEELALPEITSGGPEQPPPGDLGFTKKADAEREKTGTDEADRS
jgi:hypothetical protein